MRPACRTLTAIPLTAREVLDSGSKLVRSQLHDQPEVRARLLRTIGVVYRSLGYYEPARALLEEALATRRGHWDGDHAEVAESLDDLAELARVEGDFEQAENLARQALAMCRRLHRGDQLDTATSLSTLALVHVGRGEYRAAEPLFYEALAMRKRLLGEEHPKVARSLHNLGLMFARTGDLDSAERVGRRAHISPPYPEVRKPVEKSATTTTISRIRRTSGWGWTTNQSTRTVNTVNAAAAG